MLVQMDWRYKFVIYCHATIHNFSSVNGVVLTALGTFCGAAAGTALRLFIESTRFDWHRLKFVIHALIVVKRVLILAQFTTSEFGIALSVARRGFSRC